jgi:hypothetical protein
MVKFDLLDFGVYADDKHIADFDNEGMAIEFARQFTKNNRGNTVVICNLTCEVKFTADIVEVVTYKVKEWVAD